MVWLRVYVDRRCDDLQEQIDRRITADEKHQDQRSADNRRNLELASARVDERLESMNQFRDQLREQAATFAPRAEVEAIRTAGADRIAELTRRVDRIETERATADQAAAARARRAQTMFGVYLGVATLLLSLIVFLANYLTNR